MSNAEDRLALGRALFSPKTVALVGASADAKKLASRPQRVLRKHGFDGTIIPINPGRDEINGDKAYPDIRSVPQKIDHAFIMVPAKAVPGVIEDCAAAGVKAATIFSAGFAETGEEGMRMQRRMVETARAAGVRLIGPNCLGIANVTGHTVLSANAVLESETLVPGHLSLVSQSGSMMGGTVSRAQERGLGFSKMVSVGNECDVGVGEIVDCMVDDPDTKCILLFLEAFRDAPRLGAAARRAFELGKPVIAFKLGRSAVGREIATTHTGAIAGADDVAEAFFRDHGIIRVKTYEALFETPQLVMGFKPPRGKRVAIFTGTGGAAAMVVDQLGLAGITVVPPPQTVIDELAGKNIHINDAPLTDLPMGRAEGDVYPTIIHALERSDHCDAIVAVQGSTATLKPDSVRERILNAGRVAKPLASFLGPAANEALHILQRGGAAAFRTPEACADAVRAYCEWRAPSLHPAPDAALREKLAAGLKAQAGRPFNEYEASRFLGLLGIPFAPAQVVKDGSEAVSTGFPAVAKILSADIPHKTEAGGVVLNIADAAQLKAEVDGMLARIRKAMTQAKLDGVLVQRMARGIAEVIVGFRRDRDAGPLVMVGVGGILAELGGGHTVRLAPVTLEVAREMIDEVKAFAVLRGYRKQPKGDLEALARVVQALSQLAAAEAVAEAEINPLLVQADGVVAVDALVALKPEG
ncbi:MAG: acetate--CoA ligase family protein [Betaproteobacteria bacterium]|nr:acetate--CoA ligase family protein [Betaproteobacteria bacterium]